MRTLRTFSLLLFIILSFNAAAAQDALEARAAWQVTRYDLTVNLNAGGRSLNGRAVLSAVNIGGGVGRTMTVRLNAGAEVKAASVGEATATFRARPEPKTNLQQVTVSLPAPVNSGGTVGVTIDYRLPIADNSALASISPIGSQFLPLSYWYPTPNTQFALRGADTAPFRLTVNANDGLTVISAGQAGGAANTFEQPLFGQPFFLTGKWDVVESVAGADKASAYLPSGANAEEKKQAEVAASLALAARTYFAGFLGAPPADVPLRLVTVNRGAGFGEAGTVLLSPAVFRRPKIDALSALAIAETAARLWVGGAAPVRGEGSGVLREGLARFLAITFLEKQFGREAADAERARERAAYAAIAKRDGPLAQSTPFYDTHFNAVANKGAMVWRLADRALGREAFYAALAKELQAARGGGGLTLARLRQALTASGSGAANLKQVLDYNFDQPTGLDLLIGVPRQQGAEWVAALRNTGPVAVAVSVVGVAESGERVSVEANVPAQDFGEARFKTSAKLLRAEIDPDKLYPQLDYTNDFAPRASAAEDPLGEANKFFARQEFAKAEEKAREVLRFEPQNQEVRVILARSLAGANKLDEAAKEFRAVLDAPLPLANAVAWALQGSGDVAARRGQGAEAAKFFDQAVAADAEYGATLAARAGRIKAETGAAGPAVDESVRSFVAQLDAAIRGGKKADLDAQTVPGELATFTKGLIGNQPELWQTKVLRTEKLGADRVAADVTISTKVLGREEAGTAVLVMDKVGGAWKLSGVELFEVR